MGAVNVLYWLQRGLWLYRNVPICSDLRHCNSTVGETGCYFIICWAWSLPGINENRPTEIKALILVSISWELFQNKWRDKIPLAGLMFQWFFWHSCIVNCDYSSYTANKCSHVGWFPCIFQYIASFDTWKKWVSNASPNPRGKCGFMGPWAHT